MNMSKKYNDYRDQITEYSEVSKKGFDDNSYSKKETVFAVVLATIVVLCMAYLIKKIGG